MTEQRKIIFIVGNSRSGTTMLGRVLGNHSQIYTFGELHFFEHQVNAATVRHRSEWDTSQLLDLLERLLTSSREDFFAKVAPGAHRLEAEQILADSTGQDPISAYEAFLHYETQHNSKIIPCEQTPRYLFFVSEILQAFPEAIVINMVRDPRDVLLSQKNKWRRRFLGANNIPLREALRAWVNYHPYTIAKLWVASVRAAYRLQGDARFTSIRFEDLLLKPEEEMRVLCKIVGIGFEPEMLNVPVVGSSTGIDYPQKRGIDGSRTGGWRKGGLTRVELEICQRVAGGDMVRSGYDIEPVALSAWRRWGSMLVFGVKIPIVLLFNISRSKNIVQSIRRRYLMASQGDR